MDILRKCGHKKYQVRKDFSRTCNICEDTESPTAGTLFYPKSPWSYEIQWIAQNEWSWVSEFNIDRYLAEYRFRINRSQSKETIFNNLIKRIVEGSPVSQSQLVGS